MRGAVEVRVDTDPLRCGNCGRPEDVVFRMNDESVRCAECFLRLADPCGELDRLANRLLEKYRQPRESVVIKVISESITAKLGDTVNVLNADGSAYQNSPYRIVEMDFEWPQMLWTLTLENLRESAERDLAKDIADLQIDQVYGQGADDLYVVTAEGNVKGPDDVSVELLFDIPRETVAIGNIVLTRLEALDHQRYSAPANYTSSAEDHAGGAHAHAYAIDSHAHGVPSITLTSTTSDTADHVHDITFTSHSHGTTAIATYPPRSTSTEVDGSQHVIFGADLDHAHNESDPADANAVFSEVNGHTHTALASHQHGSFAVATFDDVTAAGTAAGSHNHDNFDPDGTDAGWGASGHNHASGGSSGGGQFTTSTDAGHSHTWTLVNHDHGDSDFTDLDDNTALSTVDSTVLHSHDIDHEHRQDVVRSVYPAPSIGLKLTAPDGTEKDITSGVFKPGGVPGPFFGSPDFDIDLTDQIKELGTGGIRGPWKLRLYEQGSGVTGRIRASLMVRCFVYSQQS